MHTWQWHTRSGLPYLTCSILAPSHGFFTRQFSPRSPEELTQVLQPSSEVYRVKQVHGNLVLSPNEVRTELGELGKLGENYPFTLSLSPLPFSPSTLATRHSDTVTTLPEADGLITEQPNQAVWVASADCTPVLMADSKTGIVAAVHAGWRGTALKIVPQAIARLLAQGSQIQDLRIALGPAIAGEVYQVSTQVASQVGASILPEDTQSILDSLQQLPDSPILPDPHPERVRLDIRRIIVLQLEQLGVSSEQVAIAPYCTYQEPEYFFSYRRDQLKKVQWSGIVSTNPTSTTICM